MNILYSISLLFETVHFYLIIFVYFYYIIYNCTFYGENLYTSWRKPVYFIGEILYTLLYRLQYVMMGKRKENLDYQRRADANYAIIIPAGTWHNIKNIGNRPLKVYSIYAPPQHPFGTVHKTKQEAERAEKH